MMIGTQTLTNPNESEGPTTAFLHRPENGDYWGREVSEFFTLGRDPSCQCSLSDLSVSARHARIEKKENGYFLRDLRSRNGTYLNGAKVVEAYLSEGDHIQIGKTRFRFSYHRTLSKSLPPLNSKNPKWKETLQQIDSFAQSDLPVLLLGPSGSGKEVLAQTLHLHSLRRHAPVVSVNCSALSESLIESELFGHAKGSFTGATNDRKGAFETARGGTLFLDEVGDLPLSLQPKLLRALENKEIRPVGRDENIKTDVRILAATHHDLRARVLRGDFRLDLYYRLNVLQLKVPPLKDRPEDIEGLLHQFCAEFGISFSIEALQALRNYEWPGNVRELRNMVAKAKAHYGNRITTRDQVLPLLEGVVEAESLKWGPRETHEKSASSGNVLKELEYEIIRKRLIANNWNQRRTALDLGIPKSTLHDRLRSYNIEVPKRKTKTPPKV